MKPKNLVNADYQEKRKRRLRGELECPRLKWVSRDDRNHLIAAGYLRPDEIDDPDAVTAALDYIRTFVFEHIRRSRIKTKS